MRRTDVKWLGTACIAVIVALVMSCEVGCIKAPPPEPPPSPTEEASAEVQATAAKLAEAYRVKIRDDIRAKFCSRSELAADLCRSACPKP